MQSNYPMTNLKAKPRFQWSCILKMLGFINIAILQSVLTACNSDTVSSDFDMHAPRIVAMQSIVQSTAIESIKIEEAWRGKPLGLLYTAYIGPRTVRLFDFK